LVYTFVTSSKGENYPSCENYAPGVKIDPPGGSQFYIEIIILGKLQMTSPKPKLQGLYICVTLFCGPPQIVQVMPLGPHKGAHQFDIELYRKIFKQEGQEGPGTLT